MFIFGRSGIGRFHENFIIKPTSPHSWTKAGKNDLLRVKISFERFPMQDSSVLNSNVQLKTLQQ
jgi:hypothetical protein